METLQRIDRWSETHPYILLGVLRMLLGAFLFYKGLEFASDKAGLQQMMSNSQVDFISLGLVHYVVMAHLVGGVLIAIGLITRVAVAFQIPILLGAIIFVNSERGFYSMGSELWVSLVVLALLLLFLFYGSGPLSMDRHMRSHPEF